MKKLDIVNQRFNKLVVIRIDRSSGKPYADVKCDCGNTASILAYSLTSGNSKSCGLCLPTELIGQRYGRLAVIDVFRGQKNSRTIAKCSCDCGKLIDIYVKKLGHKKSCGCLWTEHKQTFLANKNRGKQPKHTLPKGIAAARYVYKNYLNNAKLKNIAFSLTREKFVELTSQSCHYCGVPPLQVFNLKNNLNGLYYYNGLDRLIPAIGYIETNVVPCCITCNRFKSDLLSHDEMVKIIEHLRLLRGGKLWEKVNGT